MNARTQKGEQWEHGLHNIILTEEPMWVIDVWSGAGMEGLGKRGIPEETHRPAASYGTIPTCENPGVTRPGIYPCSPKWARGRCEQIVWLTFSSTARSLGAVQVAGWGGGGEWRGVGYGLCLGPTPPFACRAKPGWPDRESNLGPPECESRELPLRHLARQLNISTDGTTSSPLCVTHAPSLSGATVAGRLARSPPIKANRGQSPAGSPDFHKCESCRTMPLVGGFSRGSPISPASSFRRYSIFTSITLIGSQDHALMMAIEASMEQRRNERVGETGYRRENPPANGVVRHDPHMRGRGVAVEQGPGHSSLTRTIGVN
ncbi:hypothetical protein PR048_032394 [Dryococelus australis]|uniref:Uncharacterized protein n=1 Tax=Dryococelus australis TaxID=614101 RepID=A0ABQ9G390_9NEOP|nr:hypothetical protein PR048_032394 [Dryococelus australis]